MTSVYKNVYIDKLDDIVKDSHRETAPLIKTPALLKSMNLGNWFVGTSNQLFLRGS